MNSPVVKGAWGVCVVVLLVVAPFALGASSKYHLINTFAFPNAPGSKGEYFDYVTVDAAARRVYLSRGTAVQVMDADSGASLGFISGFARQHGVAVAPEFNRGFISDGETGEITIFDLKTLKVLTDVKSDPDTDCVVYDPASKSVFSMNGDSDSSTVVNAETGKIVKTIALGGAPEFAVADGRGKIYASLQDKNQIAVIDTRELTIKARWPVLPAGAPTSIAIDPEHRRVFSAGRDPAMLDVLNADNGKVIQSFPISGGTDAAAYDSETGMIFVSTIQGNVHVFHEDSPDVYTVLDTVKTEYGAKTMGLDQKTHRLFLDTADFLAPAGGASRRRMPVPGTFRVLVYGQ